MSRIIVLHPLTTMVDMNIYRQIGVIAKIGKAQAAIDKRYSKWDTPLDLNEFLSIATALNEAMDLLKGDIIQRVK